MSGARVSETTLPGVQVRVEPLVSAGYQIVVHGTTGAFRGGFKGVITVNTDVPGEETLIIRYAGYVK